MEKMVFKGFDGDWYEAKTPAQESALARIQDIIERNMPVETVEADRLKRAVANINIVCSRDLTAKEANTLVLSIKQLVINEIDRAEKFYLDRNKGAKK